MYTGRRRKSPRDRRLGGRGKKGGTLGRQASFDFIVIKSAKEKSRENNKQTENKRREKGREKGGLKTSRRKKESEKKKSEHEICRIALPTSETIRPRFVCPIEFKA